MLWRLLVLPVQARKSGIQLVFSPGGNWLFGVKYVSMAQNMLVFESAERNRFPAFLDRLRYQVLEVKQTLSFTFSRGILHVSNYAKDYISEKYPHLKTKPSGVVYHGISDRFSGSPKLTDEKPRRFLYLSILNYYKHQDQLIRAFQVIHKIHPDVHLDLIGPAHPKYLEHLKPLLEEGKEFVTYHGPVPYSEVHEFYKNADAFVFASTCESISNIIVEAMKSGLPTLCSSYGPMPEMIGENCLFFDPCSLEDTIRALTEFLDQPNRYREMAIQAVELSKKFSWEACADETFGFLRNVANQ
jgi:glycosyltransferase involved in cell wall biosynthesis